LNINLLIQEILRSQQTETPFSSEPHTNQKEHVMNVSKRNKSCQRGNVFRFPDVEDVGAHGMEDVVLLFPHPNHGTTSRSAGHFRFDCDQLQWYNVM